MSDTLNPVERALQPLPPAENIDPALFETYGSMLLDRPDAQRPSGYFAQASNMLEFAIASGSKEQGEVAFDTMRELAGSGQTEEPLLSEICGLLAYEPAMRQRVQASQLTRKDISRVYRGLTRLTIDTLGNKHLDETDRLAIAGRYMTAAALARTRDPVRFPYFATLREQANTANPGANHEVYTLFWRPDRRYKLGLMQIDPSRNPAHPQVYPVRLVPMLGATAAPHSEALELQPDELNQPEAVIGALAKLMWAETAAGGLPGPQLQALNDLTKLVRTQARLGRS
jgi:hypothetical protein